MARNKKDKSDGQIKINLISHANFGSSTLTWPSVRSYSFEGNEYFSIAHLKEIGFLF